MKIILGVGGGIAAYKSAEIARLLMQGGHEVQAVMTSAAQEFIRPLTFAALTGRKTLTDLFAIESAIEHISVAQENELMAIAPATADLIAKLAHGLADDFLTTLYLAFTGPVVVAPSMNSNMWHHPATQANLETLRLRGHRVLMASQRELVLLVAADLPGLRHLLAVLAHGLVRRPVLQAGNREPDLRGRELARGRRALLPVARRRKLSQEVRQRLPEAQLHVRHALDAAGNRELTVAAGHDTGRLERRHHARGARHDD